MCLWINKIITIYASISRYIDHFLTDFEENPLKSACCLVNFMTDYAWRLLSILDLRSFLVFCCIIVLSILWFWKKNLVINDKKVLWHVLLEIWWDVLNKLLFWGFHVAKHCIVFHSAYTESIQEGSSHKAELFFLTWSRKDHLMNSYMDNSDVPSLSM